MRYLAIKIKNLHETILKDIVGIQIRHIGKKKKKNHYQTLVKRPRTLFELYVRLDIVFIKCALHL